MVFMDPIPRTSAPLMIGLFFRGKAVSMLLTGPIRGPEGVSAPDQPQIMMDGRLVLVLGMTPILVYAIGITGFSQLGRQRTQPQERKEGFRLLVFSQHMASNHPVVSDRLLLSFALAAMYRYLQFNLLSNSKKNIF